VTCSLTQCLSVNNNKTEDSIGQIIDQVLASMIDYLMQHYYYFVIERNIWENPIYGCGYLIRSCDYNRCYFEFEYNRHMTALAFCCVFSTIT